MNRTEALSYNTLAALKVGEVGDLDIIDALLDWGEQINAMVESLVCVAGPVVGPRCSACGASVLEQADLDADVEEALRPALNDYLVAVMVLDGRIDSYLDELFDPTRLARVEAYAGSVGAELRRVVGPLVGVVAELVATERSFDPTFESAGEHLGCCCPAITLSSQRPAAPR